MGIVTSNDYYGEQQETDVLNSPAPRTHHPDFWAEHRGLPGFHGLCDKMNEN